MRRCLVRQIDAGVDRIENRTARQEELRTGLRGVSPEDGGEEAGRFRRDLYKRLGLDPDSLIGQDGAAQRHALKPKLAAIFKQRTRAEWCKVFEGSDACFAPVLSIAETAAHPHNVARGALQVIDGITQPAPAPRFQGTPSPVPRPPRRSGTDTDDVLPRWGVDADTIGRLRAANVLA